MADEHTEGTQACQEIRGIFELIKLPLCAIIHSMKGSIQYCLNFFYLNPVTKSLLQSTALGKKNLQWTVPQLLSSMYVCASVRQHFAFILFKIFGGLVFLVFLFPTQCSKAISCNTNQNIYSVLLFLLWTLNKGKVRLLYTESEEDFANKLPHTFWLPQTVLQLSAASSKN